MALRAVGVALAIAVASPASAATLSGLVFDDTNRDGLPSAGEPGVPNVVVALGAGYFTTTDATGQFQITDLASGTLNIAWARVPNGFTPGPAWARVDLAKSDHVDIALRRLPSAPTGPVTFVVAADTHMPHTQDWMTSADLANAANLATQLDPAPAFFTILGDITQGNRDIEFELVDDALSGIGVPYVPVPGNHDWYDKGFAWFTHYGPDNYSFDIGTTHFVVWNMAMGYDDVRRYLGEELSRVAPEMTVVALTHAPPSVAVIDVLRTLGVDYVLTGHAHSNRVVDHDGVIELNTEPMLMGALEFTPAGYRVLTLDGGRLASYHRTTVDEPFLSIMSPRTGACVPPTAGRLIASAELDGGAMNVVAEVDCSTPVALRAVGGWAYEVELPPLAPGPHVVRVSARSVAGTVAEIERLFEVCSPPAPPAAGEDWAQLGGGAAHAGARDKEIAPPLVTRWVASVGGHAVTAPPVIAGGIVYVPVTDLGDGNAGGVAAFDLLTGASKWRVPTARPVRGGIAVEDGIVVVPLIDGVVLGLDVANGDERWRYELSTGLAPEAGVVFAAPAAENGDVFIGNQRNLAVLGASTGGMLWRADPVPEGRDSQSAAAVALRDELAVGTFNRAFGGVIAWDRTTGTRLWNIVDSGTVAVNASPVIDGEQIYIVSGATDVTALDHQGHVRWRTKLDPEGFDWGHATVGTPALARGVLVVPSLYRDLVALDAATGAELWRFAARPGPLRTTHYRSGGEAGFAASPVITGDIVWAVDTSGQLSALELQTGSVLWKSPIGAPVLAGLAVSGDWLIAASYDGTVRALVPTSELRVVRTAPTCVPAPVATGCCETQRTSPTLVTFLLGLVVAAATLRRRRR
jgi:outer membrane protein assembly factor BamB